jgi:hypothetical protein
MIGSEVFRCFSANRGNKEVFLKAKLPSIFYGVRGLVISGFERGLVCDIISM